MNFQIKKDKQITQAQIRSFGYAPHRGRSEKQSFVRRIHGEEFPRFHLYIDKEDEHLIYCSLHLDQKAPVYSGSKAHGGDYDSPEVVEEASRLQN